MKKNLKKDYSKLADVRVLQRIVDDTGYVDAKNTEGINVSNSKLNRKKKLTRKNITKAPVKNIRRAYKELQKFTEDNITLYKDRLNVEKRLSVPPRQGLVYDEAKKRWTRPEEVGKTVKSIKEVRLNEELRDDELNSLGTNLAYRKPYCLPSPVSDVVRLVLSAILYPAAFSKASTS